MSRNSIRAGISAVRKVLNTFAAINVVALLTLTVSTGCAASPPERQVDRVITEQVYDALAADPIHYYRHVDVYVRDGVVTLSGYVFEPQDFYRATKLTARVPGVVRVNDQMELWRWQ